MRKASTQTEICSYPSPWQFLIARKLGNVLGLALCTGVCILGIACDSSGGFIANEDPNIGRSNVGQNPDTIEKSEEWVRETEEEIYTHLLTQLYYKGVANPDGGDIVIPPLNGPKWILYRDSTYAPNFQEPCKIPEIVSEDLWDDFERRNSEQRKLPKSFPADLVAKPTAVTGALSVVLQSVRKELPKAYYVVSFSRVGFDSKYSVGLVFIQFYDEQSGLVGIFYEIPLNDTSKAAKVIRSSKSAS